jgi:hypothetical protein
MEVIDEETKDFSSDVGSMDQDVEFHNYRLMDLNLNEDLTLDRNYQLNRIYKTITRRIEKETKIIEENILMEMYLDNTPARAHTRPTPFDEDNMREDGVKPIKEKLKYRSKRENENENTQVNILSPNTYKSRNPKIELGPSTQEINRTSQSENTNISPLK